MDKWIHIMKEQPKHGQKIVQLELFAKGDFLIAVRDYVQYCTWEDYIKFIDENGYVPNFWWMPIEEFPLPEVKYEVV